MPENGNKNGKPKWLGYYDLQPTKEEKAAIKKSILKPTDYDRVIEEVTDRGYKVSLSYDGYHNAFLVAVTGARKNCTNAGWTLTSRHSDLRVALSAAYWYVAVATGWGAWPELKQPTLDIDW